MPAAAVSGEPARAPAPPAPLSKAELIDTLTRSGTPENALAAFAVLDQCVVARRRERSGRRAEPDAATACGDISPGQLVARGQLAEKAAQAGVRGAYLSFVLNGIDGSEDLPAGTADDLSQAAKAEYFRKAAAFRDIAARKGDRTALVSGSIYAENAGQDPATALTYWAAQEKIGRAAGAAADPSYDAIVARIGQPLSAQEVTAALAEAERIAQSAAAPCAQCRTSPSVEAAADLSLRMSLFAQQDILRQSTFASGARPVVLPGGTITICRDDCDTAVYQATGTWIPRTIR